MAAKLITVIVSIKASRAWLAKSKLERANLRKRLFELVYSFEGIKFTFLDADSFSSDYTDIVICETQELLIYHQSWDKIKDNSIFAKGYYSITDVRMGIK